MTSISRVETSTDIANKENSKIKNRVCSEDKNIWIGMTTRDAAKSTELMELFDFADYNRDGKIDDSELQRYNGPILVQNIETSDTRCIGTHRGFDTSGSIDAKLIKNNEIDYYPGLTVDKVNEKGRKVFTLIDNDHNGILSEDEITKILGIKNKVEEVADTIEEVRMEKFNSRMKAGLYSGLGTLAAVGIGVGVAEGSILVGLIMGGGAAVMVGIVVAGVGYALYELCTGNNNKKQAEELINNLKKEIGNEPYVQEYKMIEKLKGNNLHNL